MPIIKKSGGSGGGGVVVWGSITGTLSNQTDLQNALDAKLSTSLTSARIFVGNGSNVATGVAVGGEATMANTGSLTVNNSAVIGKVLTGYVSGAGTVAATDTILQAVQKLNGNDALKAPIASPAFTTQVTFSGYHIEPSEFDSGNSGTSKTIDWANASAQKSTLTGSVTYTFSNPVSGGAYVLRVIQGSGPYSVTWPATVKWAGGVTPIVTTINTHMDIFSFYFDGTNYYGSFTQDYTP